MSDLETQLRLRAIERRVESLEREVPGWWAGTIWRWITTALIGWCMHLHFTKQDKPQHDRTITPPSAKP